MVYITYNISYEAFQAKHQPRTPNRIQIAPFFTPPYAFAPHTKYPIYLNQSKVTYEDEIDAENQKLFKSLTDKLYI